MRWDRLFADLEEQADDLELADRDVLVDELRDGTWAETGWRELLGGHTVLDVAGVGRVEGVVQLVNEHLVHLAAERREIVVAAGAVLAVLDAERRASEPSLVASRLGWGHLFRATRDDDDPVRVTRVDGSTVDGRVDAVGRDFVRLAHGAGHRLVPFAAIAALTVSGR